jgi:hypothetical protein
MKHLKDFNKYNESILGDIQRLSPSRLSNDKKAAKLFDDILKDFEKHNDLRKVKIIDDGGTSINLHQLRIGEDYNLTYIFGPYHPINGDAHTGNRKAGDRRVIIKSLPFFYTIKRNELEKAFNTNRMKFGSTWVEEINMKHNWDRDPNDPENRHLLDEDKDRYKISGDVASKLFKYFIDEFNEKFPELKDGKYKSSMSINTIKRGGKPTLDYVDVFNADGKEVILAIKAGDDKKELEKRIRKMTTAETNKLEAERKEQEKKELEPYYKGVEKQKEEFINKFDKAFKDAGIELEGSKWEPKGFRLVGFSPEWENRIEFKYKGDISEKVKTAINSVDGYRGEIKSASKSYSFEKNGLYFYLCVIYPDK